jgi:hypothetical protein
MTSPHLDALCARHLQLEGKISEETHRPQPDSMRLSALKRQKLKVKEEMARIG